MRDRQPTTTSLSGVTFECDTGEGRDLFACFDGFTPTAENDLADTVVDSITVHIDYEHRGRERSDDHLMYFCRN